jgi:hypothetical protein
MSLRSHTGYASTRICNEQRRFIFACGGENITEWEILPRVQNLLGANLNNVLEEISKANKEQIDSITIKDVKSFIETNHPEWIKEWVSNVFSDKYGDISNYSERVYSNLIDRAYNSED